jgi:hypothetical protein
VTDEKFPEPPDPRTLAGVLRRDEDVVAVHTATMLWRVHLTHGRHVVPWNQLRAYGPVPSARFDPQPSPPGVHPVERVGYLACERADTAVAEAFQAHRVLDRQSGRPYLVGLRLAREVRLLDLGGTWPTRAGASQAISSGSRLRARVWARAIRAAHPDLDGVWYPSSTNAGLPCLALWTPAADAMPAHPVVSKPLSDPALAAPLAEAAARLGYRFL